CQLFEPAIRRLRVVPGQLQSDEQPDRRLRAYEIPLTASPAFASNDLVNIDFTTLPIGTFALGYGTPSLTVIDTPFTEAGVGGVGVAAAPEPTSLTLRVPALLALGWRRRRD